MRRSSAKSELIFRDSGSRFAAFSFRPGRRRYDLTSAATVNHPNMNKPLVLSNRDLDPSRSESELRCLAGVK
jgi:hypothetical protein